MSSRTNIEKAIKAVAQERMVVFEEAINTLLADKLLVAIERHRPVVSQKMFEGHSGSTTKNRKMKNQGDYEDDDTLVEYEDDGCGDEESPMSRAKRLSRAGKPITKREGDDLEENITDYFTGDGDDDIIVEDDDDDDGPGLSPWEKRKADSEEPWPVRTESTDLKKKLTEGFRAGRAVSVTQSNGGFMTGTVVEPPDMFDEYLIKYDHKSRPERVPASRVRAA